MSHHHEGRFRKKPVVIEAIRCETAMVRLKHHEENRLPTWLVEAHDKKEVRVENGYIMIVTLEGEMIASPDDMIICGVKGELYPCKPDVFENTYEVVDG